MGAARIYWTLFGTLILLLMPPTSRALLSAEATPGSAGSTTDECHEPSDFKQPKTCFVVENGVVLPPELADCTEELPTDIEGALDETRAMIHTEEDGLNITGIASSRGAGTSFGMNQTLTRSARLSKKAGAHGDCKHRAEFTNDGATANVLIRFSRLFVPGSFQEASGEAIVRVVRDTDLTDETIDEAKVDFFARAEFIVAGGEGEKIETTAKVTEGGVTTTTHPEMETFRPREPFWANQSVPASIKFNLEEREFDEFADIRFEGEVRPGFALAAKQPAHRNRRIPDTVGPQLCMVRCGSNGAGDPKLVDLQENITAPAPEE